MYVAALPMIQAAGGTQRSESTRNGPENIIAAAYSRGELPKEL